jgi:hypothetical protein
LVDQSFIRVPKVLRFFPYMNVGYIVMEFMDRQALSASWDTVSCHIIAKALAHFSQIWSDQPGPLGGGLACGLLWIEGNWISPTSSSDSEQYFNTRQLHHQNLDIKGQSFVLCHLDIALRSILRLRDGSFCLLDWASAGFYPRSFGI